MGLEVAYWAFMRGQLPFGAIVGLIFVGMVTAQPACSSEPLPQNMPATAGATEGGRPSAGSGGGASGPASDCPEAMSKLGRCLKLDKDGCPDDATPWLRADGLPCIEPSRSCRFEDSCDDPDVDYAGATTLSCEDGFWVYREEDIGPCEPSCGDAEAGSGGAAAGAGGASIGDCG